MVTHKNTQEYQTLQNMSEETHLPIYQFVNCTIRFEGEVIDVHPSINYEKSPYPMDEASVKAKLREYYPGAELISWQPGAPFANETVTYLTPGQPRGPGFVSLDSLKS